MITDREYVALVVEARTRIARYVTEFGLRPNIVYWNVEVVPLGTSAGECDYRVMTIRLSLSRLQKYGFDGHDGEDSMDKTLRHEIAHAHIGFTRVNFGKTSSGHNEAFKDLLERMTGSRRCYHRLPVNKRKPKKMGRVVVSSVVDGDYIHYVYREE